MKIYILIFLIFLSASYRGEKQILKIRYYNLTREINLNLIGKEIIVNLNHL